MTAMDRWARILEGLLGPLVHAASDEPSWLAGRMLGVTVATASPAPIETLRREHAALLGYVRSLVGSRQPVLPGGVQRTTGQPGNHSQIEAAFGELASFVAGRATPSLIRSLVASHNGGTFTKMTADDQLEAWWYQELMLLHCVASFALLSGDQRATDVVLAGADFHRAEIQPDHATADPWAIHAFIINPRAQDLAETILNAAMIQYAGEPRGFALVLLAEALYCLRHVAQHGIHRGNPESI